MIGELVAKGENTFPTRTLTKRLFQVLDKSENQMQRLEFELLNDQCKIIDEFNLGDHLLIQFRIRSTDWRNAQGRSRMIQNLVTIKIEKIDPENSI